MRHTSLVLAAALAAVSCGGDDELRLVPCIEKQSAFDIEGVSTLEDAYMLPGGADAVILDQDPARVPAGATWRVGSLDVLLMIPSVEFDRYPGGVVLTAEVWDGDNPKLSEPWRVSQVLEKGKLQWERVVLDHPELSEVSDYRRAWWTFDFSSVIPESGMTSSRYMVGVRWPEGRKPLVGASNFNRPCDVNWSDFDDGEGWVLNSLSDGSPCNWPMLRVNSEVVTQKTQCD